MSLLSHLRFGFPEGLLRASAGRPGPPQRSPVFSERVPAERLPGGTSTHVTPHEASWETEGECNWHPHRQANRVPAVTLGALSTRLPTCQARSRAACVLPTVCV